MTASPFPDDVSGTDCLAYCRVSTERQAGETVTSLADQAAACERRAAAMGKTIGAWFRDEGASGATAEQRPGFSAMLRACAASPRRRQRPGTIIVLNDSRFGRFDDPEDAAYYRGVLRRAGWFVRFAEGDESEDKGVRTLTRAIHSVQSTAHRDAIRANAVRGMRGAASQGFWIGRAPFGYRRAVVYPPGRGRVLDHGVLKASDEKIRLTPHDAEAIVVRALFERYAAGADSLDSLVEWLLSADAPPAAHGHRWTRPGVRWLLRNPAYVGDVVAGRLHSQLEDRRAFGPRPAADHYGKRDAHPALVTRAVYASVQARLRHNAGAARAVRSDWLVTGVVTCRCGAPMAAGGGGGRNGRVASYRCVTRGRHPSARCAYPGTVVKPWLERAVVDTVAAELRTTKARRRLEAALDEDLAADVAPADVREALDRKAAALLAKRDRLADAVADGAFTAAEVAGQLADLRAQLAAVDAEREALERAADTARSRTAERTALLDRLHDFARAAATLAGPTLRELLRPWLRSATFDTATRVLTLEIRHSPALGTLVPASAVGEPMRSSCLPFSCRPARGSR